MCINWILIKEFYLLGLYTELLSKSYFVSYHALPPPQCKTIGTSKRSSPQPVTVSEFVIHELEAIN